MAISTLATWRPVLPPTIRRKLGIKKGAKIGFVWRNGKLILLPLNKPYFEVLSGILGTSGDLLKGLMKDKKWERKL